MPSPFTGMDPYLENPVMWSSVHHNLIHEIQADLQPQLLPRYVAAVEERVYLEPVERERIPDVRVTARPEAPQPEREHAGGGVAVAQSPVAVELPEPDWIPAEPGLEIHEAYIEILDVAGNEVITVIEVLSASNKVSGPGRDAYLGKQQQVLGSATNLVEIDLLRRGLDTVAAPAAKATRNGRADYVICTRRTARPGGFEVVRFTVRDVLPCVRIPLRAGESDVVLHLPDVLTRSYEVGAYAYRIDYRQDADPPLPPADAAWAQEVLRAKGLRPMTG